jgi:hypothetical protein
MVVLVLKSGFQNEIFKNLIILILFIKVFIYLEVRGNNSVVRVLACHAKGRGFESRFSRFACFVNL